MSNISLLARGADPIQPIDDDRLPNKLIAHLARKEQFLPTRAYTVLEQKLAHSTKELFHSFSLMKSFCTTENSYTETVTCLQ